MQKPLAHFEYRPEARGAMKARAISQNAKFRYAFMAAFVCVAFLWTLTLAFSPHLHVLAHSDAQQSQHECAVTLIAAGKYNDTSAAPLIKAPALAVQFSKIPALASVWVESLFEAASVFEHAPPARV